MFCNYSLFSFASLQSKLIFVRIIKTNYFLKCKRRVNYLWLFPFLWQCFLFGSVFLLLFIFLVIPFSAGVFPFSFCFSFSLFCLFHFIFLFSFPILSLFILFYLGGFFVLVQVIQVMGFYSFYYKDRGRGSLYNGEYNYEKG